MIKIIKNMNIINEIKKFPFIKLEGSKPNNISIEKIDKLDKIEGSSLNLSDILEFIHEIQIFINTTPKVNIFKLLLMNRIIFEIIKKIGDIIVGNIYSFQFKDINVYNP